MDLDLQPKPESKLMSLVTQTISLFNSMDFDSLPKPLSKLISIISQKVSLDSYQNPWSDVSFRSRVDRTLNLDPEPELISLIRQVVSVVIPMNSKSEKLISLCPQVEGRFKEGKFEVSGEVQWDLYYMWECFFGEWEKFSLTGGQDAIHFHCRGCNGEYHKYYEMAPLKIKHPLHQKHFLLLVLNSDSETRGCYCCDEHLKEVFYYCSVCDNAMNIACVEKPPVLYIPPAKWHEHTLALFPRWASLTCNVCALADPSSPIYMCPPCDFVVHLTCINLPRVIRISRHLHRIYYTQSFEEGDLSCGIFRRKIDNDYGGYSCIRDGCSYAAHSRCATQSNVWDGIDLEGEPEEMEEEEVEPFVRISNGIIRHFSHEHHHLRLDENTSIDYDENKQCHACITPIYFGNFYSCVQCEFVLHETCANLSRKLYHLIHPHLLTLALVRDVKDYVNSCSVCGGSVTAGFFYECSKEECNFQLHVDPLFLTTKPGQERDCHVCGRGRDNPKCSKETFNCIECDGFALCFSCATLPHKVRYTHDKHILTLSYGEKTSTITYWCEACEEQIYQPHGFYMCEEYCCVTLHIRCLIGRELYMKPGSSFSYFDRQVGVLPNNHHMSRPICSKCEKRCMDKIVFQFRRNRLIRCSELCLFLTPYY